MSAAAQLKSATEVPPSEEAAAIAAEQSSGWFLGATPLTRARVSLRDAQERQSGTHLHPRGAQQLARLLEGADVENFFRNAWGKNFYYLSGKQGRFDTLIDWATLASLLGNAAIAPRHVELARAGKRLPAEDFYRAGSGSPEGTGLRINCPAINAELKKGATLIINAIDELHAPLTRVAENLQCLFGVNTQINLYASWGMDAGFAVHWDSHDVLVLQVAGRKSWSLYGKTREAPVEADRGQPIAIPKEKLWNHTLESGDVLYVPRGWWHLVEPVNEPTMHLTIGIHNRTGLDFLGWCVEQLRAHAITRKDIPRFAGAQEQRQYSKELLELLSSQAADTLLEQYMDFQDASMQARPYFAFPWPRFSADQQELKVRWRGSTARVPRLDRSASTCSMECFGKRWLFAAAAEPVLAFLMRSEAVKISEAQEKAEPGERARVAPFLRELFGSALLSVETDRESTRACDASADCEGSLETDRSPRLYD